MEKTITFKGVRFGQELIKGQGWATLKHPFEMECVLEKEHVAVSPDGVHCWIRFLDGQWRFGLWESYRLDSTSENGSVDTEIVS